MDDKNKSIPVRGDTYLSDEGLILSLTLKSAEAVHQQVDTQRFIAAMTKTQNDFIIISQTKSPVSETQIKQTDTGVKLIHRS